MPKGQTKRAPLGRTPAIDTPLKRVTIDIIGSLKSPSRKGSRFILMMVGYVTRFPEAVALSSIKTERVTEAVVNIFRRVGVSAIGDKISSPIS